MEHVDYATGAAALHPDPAAPPNGADGGAAGSSAPGGKPSAASSEGVAGSAVASSASAAGGSSQGSQKHGGAARASLSPGTKRRISQGPGNGIAPEPAEGAGRGPSALAKRPKPEEPPPKCLPQAYEFCAIEDVVVLIANMLGELIETNDPLAMKTGHLTRFHSRTAPGISVLDYLHRLAKHATLSPPLLLSMVYYIDRLCALYPEFTINTLTVHRFLITAATVAAKGLSDAFWNNSTYARVGGVKLAELKLLELEFLHRLDWKIVPNPEILVAYYQGLVDRCPGYTLQPEEGDEEDEDEEIDEDDDDSDATDDDDDEAGGMVTEEGDSQSGRTANGSTPPTTAPSVVS